MREGEALHQSVSRCIFLKHFDAQRRLFGVCSRLLRHARDVCSNRAMEHPRGWGKGGLRTAPTRGNEVYGFRDDWVFGA